MKLNKLIFTLSLGAVFLVSPAQSQETDPSELMKVVSYDLVSKKRVGRSTFEYEYALKVENNTDTDYSGVFVTLNAPSAAVELIDAAADIGTMNAFSGKAANDTIKIRVDRRIRFNPSSLAYVFDNESAEGIDSNDNGVQDLVDAYLKTAKENLIESDFAIGIEYARILQAQLISPDLDAALEAQKNLQLLLTCGQSNKGVVEATFEKIYDLTILSSDVRFIAHDSNYLQTISKRISLVPDLDQLDCSLL